MEIVEIFQIFLSPHDSNPTRLRVGEFIRWQITRAVATTTNIAPITLDYRGSEGTAIYHILIVFRGYKVLEVELFLLESQWRGKRAIGEGLREPVERD